MFSPSLQVVTGAVNTNYSIHLRQNIADGIVSSDLLFTQSTGLILHFKNTQLKIKTLFNLKSISMYFVGSYYVLA